MVIPIYAMVAALALPAALSPKLEPAARNAALRVLYWFEVPLDAHADRLLRLSTVEELQDELLHVLVGCISDRAFADTLNRIPLDVIDIELMMDALFWKSRQHDPEFRPRTSIKPFLYRVIRWDDPRSARAAVGRLADWCDLNLLDHVFLHYLAWCRTIDIRTTALRVLADTEEDSLSLALSILECSSIVNDAAESNNLLFAAGSLGPYRIWTCARIDFTIFLAHETEVVIQNALKLMINAQVYSHRYLPQVLQLLLSKEQITRGLAQSWLTGFARRCVYLSP